ncbi:hypothetical protein CTAYLR_007953 [Chrysophaeum taylorii]|uniref:EF-hand domain-containing protein n=1 Tax=Chrysophaeum taylorii TaxID=2483200 RepID=A0AAD7U9Z0_9STRA|nr:hypothetical protein CTAYLR_007953 [Chrysophaeum taylorii]
MGGGVGFKKLRIVHLNDVYTLEHLPRVKSLVASFQDDSMTLVSCGGDFLAPYVLSTLDHGAGMVEVLNAIPTTHAILGNHECDVPHEALLDRIDEFRGKWLNSNFRALGSSMPEYDIVEINGARIGIVGVLCDYPQLYRASSFNGLVDQIRDPVAVATELASELKSRENCDAIIALTHLDFPDDQRLAQGGQVALILGGHDHQILNTKEGDVRILKAGMNAEQVAIVEWTCGPGLVLEEKSARIVEVKAYPEDAETRRLVDAHMLKVRALDKMVLTTVNELKSELFATTSRLSLPLTSAESRLGECSVATMLCSVLKWELDVDCCILEAGSVRGNQTYDAAFTFAHLKQEMPFLNATGIAAIDGTTFAKMIRESRAKPGPNFLHVDADCIVVDGNVRKVDGSEIKPSKVYSVAVGVDLGFGSSVNQTMIQYAKDQPTRIPSLESAIPAKTVILTFFAQRFWRRLPAFDELCEEDAITFDDLHDAFVHAFMTHESQEDVDAAKQMVKQLIVSFDKDNDGKISRLEYEAIFSRHARRRNYAKCAVRRNSCSTFYLRRDASLIHDDGDTTP